MPSGNLLLPISLQPHWNVDPLRGSTSVGLPWRGDGLLRSRNLRLHETRDALLRAALSSACRSRNVFSHRVPCWTCRTSDDLLGRMQCRIMKACRASCEVAFACAHVKTCAHVKIRWTRGAGGLALQKCTDCRILDTEEQFKITRRRFFSYGENAAGDDHQEYERSSR